jgi:hypothetical protein
VQPVIEVVDFEHHHVRTDVGAATVEQPARSGVISDGGDDLDELIADAHQSVVQAELGDTRVFEADVECELSAQSIDGRVEVTGGKDNLA